MPVEDIDTPALLIDLDAFERNVEKMADFTRDAGIRLRCHAKTHKSADIARYQISRGAVGVCCQKVSEAEALVDPQRGPHQAGVERQVGVDVRVTPVDLAELVEVGAASKLVGTDGRRGVRSASSGDDEQELA